MPQDDYNAARAFSNAWQDDEVKKLRSLLDDLKCDLFKWDYYEGHSVAKVEHWKTVAKALPNRTAKQCQEKGLNDLRPHSKKGNWTSDEELIVAWAHCEHGNDWKRLAAFLPRRSENSIKNLVNSRCRSTTGIKGPLKPCGTHVLHTYARMLADAGEKMEKAAIVESRGAGGRGGKPPYTIRRHAVTPGHYPRRRSSSGCIPAEVRCELFRKTVAMCAGEEHASAFIAQVPLDKYRQQYANLMGLPIPAAAERSAAAAATRSVSGRGPNTSGDERDGGSGSCDDGDQGGEALDDDYYSIPGDAVSDDGVNGNCGRPNSDGYDGEDHGEVAAEPSGTDGGGEATGTTGADRSAGEDDVRDGAASSGTVSRWQQDAQCDVLVLHDPLASLNSLAEAALADAEMHQHKASVKRWRWQTPAQPVPVKLKRRARDSGDLEDEDDRAAAAVAAAAKHCSSSRYGRSLRSSIYVKNEGKADSDWELKWPPGVRRPRSIRPFLGKQYREEQLMGDHIAGQRYAQAATLLPSKQPRLKQYSTGLPGQWWPSLPPMPLQHEEQPASLQLARQQSLTLPPSQHPLPTLQCQQHRPSKQYQHYDHHHQAVCPPLQSLHSSRPTQQPRAQPSNLTIITRSQRSQGNEAPSHGWESSSKGLTYTAQSTPKLLPQTRSQGPSSRSRPNSLQQDVLLRPAKQAAPWLQSHDSADVASLPNGLHHAGSGSALSPSSPQPAASTTLPAAALLPPVGRASSPAPSPTASPAPVPASQPESQQVSAATPLLPALEPQAMSMPASRVGPHPPAQVSSVGVSALPDPAIASPAVPTPALAAASPAPPPHSLAPAAPGGALSAEAMQQQARESEQKLVLAALQELCEAARANTASKAAALAQAEAAWKAAQPPAPQGVVPLPTSLKSAAALPLPMGVPACAYISTKPGAAAPVSTSRVLCSLPVSSPFSHDQAALQAALRLMSERSDMPVGTLSPSLIAALSDRNVLDGPSPAPVLLSCGANTSPPLAMAGSGTLPVITAGPSIVSITNTGSAVGRGSGSARPSSGGSKTSTGRANSSGGKAASGRASDGLKPSSNGGNARGNGSASRLASSGAQMSPAYSAFDVELALHRDGQRAMSGLGSTSGMSLEVASQMEAKPLPG